MSPLTQQIFTAAVAVYVLWMLVAGRTLMWGSRDHPNFFSMNTRWVFRDEESGLYWASVGFHIVLLLAMAYLAFLQ